MNITEVRVKLVQQRGDKLLGFCTITIDNDFVVRDLKIIEGNKGIFVAMPSRKLTDNCPVCGGKNYLKARFCNECGAKLDENRAERTDGEVPKLHADIAHPVNSRCREQLQKAVVEAYKQEVDKSKQPGYVAEDLEEAPSRGRPEREPESGQRPTEKESGFEEGIFS